MPDISMCKNFWCDLRESCYRYKAKPSTFWQAYGQFEPNDDGSCDNYIKLKK